MQHDDPVQSLPALRLDWDSGLGLQRLDGDTELMNEVVQLMVATMQKRHDPMASALRQGDYLKLRQHTHVMLASLKVLGFDEQAKVFEALEAAVVTSDAPACERLGPQVHALWLGIIESLVSYQHAQG